MCGIYGEFFTTRNLSKKEDFIEINNLNALRGPDSSGFWSNGRNCQLGFRRLSILDLSISGNQPMISQDGNWVMVFNGEIYNYKEIKEELLKFECEFEGSSDSEVLINCFQFFGIEATLDKVDGMFAIGLYNAVDDKVYLIRDFAGIKPLFYSLSNGNLVFGSQYNQIVGHPLNKDSEIDLEVLKLYLEMHYMPAPFGIFTNTFQVEPGEIIEIDRECKVSKKKYWNFPELDRENLISDKGEAIELIGRELEKSVQQELNSDVPVGSFLSGGIDSPLITYYANKSQNNIKAFSIGSDSAVHDESKDAIHYANEIGCDFYLEKMTSTDALNILSKSMNGLNEPFSDFSLIPTYVVTKNAKNYCTVILSGDGGDELFFGYERFYSVLKNARFKKWPFKYMWYGLDKILFKNKHINGALLSESFGKAHKKLHSRSSKDLLDAVFPNLAKIKSKSMVCYQYSDEKDELQMLHKMRKAEFYGMMQKTLIKVDRMSMANSVEVRVPFLKKSFIELALKIDPKLSYGENRKKEILKNLLNSHIKDAPISNIKRGFTIPLEQWLREDLKKPVFDEIFNSNFISCFKISEQELQKIWKEHQNERKDHKWFIFTLYSLAVWFKSIKE